MLGPQPLKSKNKMTTLKTQLWRNWGTSQLHLFKNTSLGKTIFKPCFVADYTIPRDGKVVTFGLKLLAALCRGKLLDCLIKGQSGTVNGFRMNKILKTATKEKWQAMREIKGGWYHEAKMSQVDKQHSVLSCIAVHLREKIGGMLQHKINR